MNPLQSLAAAGTKVWLDSVDPEEIERNFKLGATGATSNPIIIGDLLGSGRFDESIKPLIDLGNIDDEICWAMTDKLVQDAQKVFLHVWEDTQHDDGWVSFELDPLLEDVDKPVPVEARTKSYIELGLKWSRDHKNRMIKVPATEGGLAAIEELVAHGTAVNVTLIFSERQYIAARDACWRGAQRRQDKQHVKTVYSIFVSRLDVYTEKHVPELSEAAQGMVGIVNAKRIYQMNKKFWADKGLALKQEMIFASTGTKNKKDPAWKYVEAFAGDDIETNPPATNKAVEESGKTFTSHVNEMPPDEVLKEIDDKVDMEKLEKVLMEEGLAKFADPQKALLKLVAKKRAELS